MREDQDTVRIGEEEAGVTTEHSDGATYVTFDPVAADHADAAPETVVPENTETATIIPERSEAAAAVPERNEATADRETPVYPAAESTEPPAIDPAAAYRQDTAGGGEPLYTAGDAPAVLVNRYAESEPLTSPSAADSYGLDPTEDAQAAFDDTPGEMPRAASAYVGQAAAWAGADGDGGSGGGDDGSGGGRHQRPRKAPQPLVITKRAFILVLILVIASATLISSGIAYYLTQNAGSYKNLSNSSLEDATGSEMTIEEIAERNADAVVEISTTVSSGMGSTLAQGAGSGVILKEDGYIATNYHVIEDTQNITVRLHNGNEYSAQIVGYDEQSDVAVIKIDETGLTTASIGKSSSLAVGDLAVVIGNPLGQLGGTVTSGIISATDRTITLDGRTQKLLQTDAAINAGNSGGGVFNSKGELVGIVVAKGSGTGIEGLGFVIPIDNVADALDDIIENGTVTGKPAAGISIYDSASMGGQSSGSSLEEGVYIAEVKGSNAQKAGFEEGDRIVEFEGEAVESSAALIKAIQTHDIGDEVTFTISRDGKEQTIKVELQSSTDIE